MANKATIRKQKAIEAHLRLNPKRRLVIGVNPSDHTAMQTKVMDTTSIDVIKKNGKPRTLANGSVIVGIYPNRRAE